MWTEFEVTISPSKLSDGDYNFVASSALSIRMMATSLRVRVLYSTTDHSAALCAGYMAINRLGLTDMFHIPNAERATMQHVEAYRSEPREVDPDGCYYEGCKLFVRITRSESQSNLEWTHLAR